MNKNLLLDAIAGKENSVINEVADAEGVKPNFLQRQIASGRIVVMQRDGKPPLGIGEGLKTKINANIGTLPKFLILILRLRRQGLKKKYGADTISELSMGGDINAIRLENIG